MSRRLEPADATDATRVAQARVRDALDLADPADFERARRGRLAGADRVRIRSERSERAVWDTGDYAFLDGEAPDTVNPSLWRQGMLNNVHGLFEVTDGIYQVRGYDISNVTFVEGESGWIVVDPLTTAETARAALDLVTEHLGERPVHAVIYTHSHADHFAGVKGVVSNDDVASGRVRVIAPEGFLEAAVSENVIAGNVMVRRAMYMYGSLLPRGPRGQVDCGLGKAIPVGRTSLIAPTDLVARTGTEMTIDGVRIVFQYTPDTEAPAEMNFHFPDRRALCMAENCTAVMHNLYTPRGARVRDALAWSKYVDEALDLFGDLSDVAFASHHWPRFGADDVRSYLAMQRDLYRYLHDQTMRLANHGYTSAEIAEMIDLPEALASEFANRGYYGTVNHNAKAVYQRYIGWFDGNPAHLHPLPPEDAAVRYVEYMGGADAVLGRAREAFDAGDYRWVAQVVDHVVFADPGNTEARELEAAALEQLGYQAESGPWRNFYLTGALELREGVPTARGGGAGMGDRAEILAAVPIEMIFDLLGVRLDGPRAAGQAIVVGWRFTDTGEEWSLRLEHSALSSRPRLDPDADATLTLARTTLDEILTQQTSIEDALGSGALQIDGDAGAPATLFGLLDDFDPRFPIVTP